MAAVKGVKKAEGVMAGSKGVGAMAAEVAVEGVAAGEEVNMEVLTVGAKEVAEAEVKVEALGTVKEASWAAAREGERAGSMEVAMMVVEKVGKMAATRVVARAVVVEGG